MTPTYRYYATIDGTETEVSPGGDWSLSVNKAEEDLPWCKDYRIKFDGTLIFAGEDYDLIIDMDCCEKIDFKITCDGKDHWMGYFSYPYDFEINNDTCEIKGTPKPLDKYYYLEQNAKYECTTLGRSTDFQYQVNFPVAPPGDNWQICLPCELLWDVVTDIANCSDLGPPLSGYSVVSTFFQNDTFPDGTNPYPTINYVTGHANKLNHIVMAMTQDVCNLDTASADLEDMPEWSWNDIMEILHNVFNVWYYIDEAGNIRIEHIYFWELYFGSDYDLTTLNNGRWLVNTNKHSYSDSDIPTEEMWEFSENQNFSQYSRIIYDCFQAGSVGEVKEYDLSKLTTDIEWVAPGAVGSNFFSSPADCGDIGSDDFMFIRCITRTEAVAAGYNPRVGCNWCAWFSEDVEFRADHVNAHLFADNLRVNYWMHDRPLWEGRLLGIPPFNLTFESTQKNLLQDVFFPTCCDSEAEIVMSGGAGTDPRYLYDFNILNEEIITQYGNGSVHDGRIDTNGMFTGTLEFEDLCGHGDPTEWSEASEL